MNNYEYIIASLPAISTDWKFTDKGPDQILEEILGKNPNARIVATAVTLESMAELTQCMKAIPFAYTEVVSMTVARDRKAGPYHLMMGQNPIFIFTMQGGNSKCGHSMP